MGNRSFEKLTKGHTVLFAFEEAIGILALTCIKSDCMSMCHVGFMYGSTVLDKDGISSLVAAAEYATSLYKGGSNFAEELQKIYQKYVWLLMFTIIVTATLNNVTHQHTHITHSLVLQWDEILQDLYENNIIIVTTVPTTYNAL